MRVPLQPIVKLFDRREIFTSENLKANQDVEPISTTILSPKIVNITDTPPISPTTEELIKKYSLDIEEIKDSAKKFNVSFKEAAETLAEVEAEMENEESDE